MLLVKQQDLQRNKGEDSVIEVLNHEIIMRIKVAVEMEVKDHSQKPIRAKRKEAGINVVNLHVGRI